MQVCSLKGEPFISALDPDQAGLDAYLRPLGFQLSK
jgi:hypothetical protein